MTNKTKAAIEEAANENYWQDKPESDIAKVHFKAGILEAIEHPERYGLMEIHETENKQGVSEPEYIIWWESLLKIEQTHFLQEYGLYGHDEGVTYSDIEWIYSKEKLKEELK